MDSTHHARPAGVTFRLQRSEYPVRTARAEVIAVLKCAPARSDLTDDTDGLEIETTLFSVDTKAGVIGCADVGAGRASDHNVNWESSIGLQPLASHVAHVAVSDHVREVPAVLAPFPVVYLAGGHRLDTLPMRRQ